MKVRTNDEWVRELSEAGKSQSAALEDLRNYLLKAAHASFQRFPGYVAGMDAVARDQLAEDCTQEALMAILSQLHLFRGESRFVTWAYKFGVNKAMTAARRVRWKDVSLETLLDDEGPTAWMGRETAPSANPERQAQANEAWAVVRDVIDQELTERQRAALRGVVIHEVPLDEVAETLGTNRNGTYKLLHDARRKLKGRLLERGFTPEEILSVFSAGG